VKREAQPLTGGGDGAMHPDETPVDEISAVESSSFREASAAPIQGAHSAGPPASRVSNFFPTTPDTSTPEPGMLRRAGDPPPPEEGQLKADEVGSFSRVSSNASSLSDGVPFSTVLSEAVPMALKPTLKRYDSNHSMRRLDSRPSLKRFDSEATLASFPDASATLEALQEDSQKTNPWLILVKDRKKHVSLLKHRRKVTRTNIERSGLQARTSKEGTSIAKLVEETSQSEQAISHTAALEERIACLEQKYVLSSTTQVPGRLTRQFEAACEEMGGTWSVLHSSNPIAAALAKKQYVALFALISLAFWAWTFSSALEVRAHGRVSSREFRFVPFETRNGTAGADIHQAGVDLVGVLVEGCFYEARGTVVEHKGSSLYVRYPEEVEVSGWYLVTSTTSPPDMDPRSFAFHRLGDDGQWKAMGGSAWRFNAVQGLYLREGYFNLPLERGIRVPFDQRAPWHWALSKAGPMLTIAIVFMLLLFFASKRMYYTGKYVLGGGLLCCSLLYTISACADTSVAGNWFSFWWWLVFASTLSGLSVIFIRRFFVQALLITGVGCLVVGLVEYAWYTWHLNGFLYATVAGTLILLAAFGLLWHRILVVRNVTRMIADDAALYAQVWKRLCKEDGFKDDCEHLRRVCESAGGSKKARATNKIAPAPSLAASGESNLSRSNSFTDPSAISVIRTLLFLHKSRGTIDSYYPAKQLSRINKFGSLLPYANEAASTITCLDQLFAQATELDTFLTRKVKIWAYHSEGLVRLAPQSAEDPLMWMPWKKAKNHRATEKRIMWVPLKSPERAIAKSLKRYDREVHRLVDICRQEIAFRNIRDLMQCVHEVCRDRDVTVERIKNRMHDDVDMTLTAGFRSIVINLKIQSTESEGCGVEGHVCELILLLLDFAELRTEERHARYISYRDAMGA